MEELRYSMPLSYSYTTFQSFGTSNLNIPPNIGLNSFSQIPVIPDTEHKLGELNLHAQLEAFQRHLTGHCWKQNAELFLNNCIGCTKLKLATCELREKYV